MTREIQTEKLMDQALALDHQPKALQELDTETIAAVAACYRYPYHTYGRVKAYIRDNGRLPPYQYQKPRHLWQRMPTPGALCRKCENLKMNQVMEMTCPMLQLRGAAGMRGAVVKCSEFAKKHRKRRKRTTAWAGDEEMV